MATFFFVPTEAQTKSDTCWHASAQMLWYYWQSVTKRQGPMNTLANNWENNKPITPREFILLAEKVGLRKVDTVPASLSSDDIAKLLLKHGPLWCAGFWFGPGHIIVLTGINNDTVYINDPDGGVRKTGKLDWFKEKLANSVSGYLMYKDPNAY